MSAPPPISHCAGCRTQLAPALLSCPACGRLVHSDELKRLAAEAEQATQRGDLTGALTGWRQALALLPPDSRQHAAITARIDALGRSLGTALPAAAPASPAPSTPGERPAWMQRVGPLGGLAVVLLGLLSKGKLLLTGLTKASTFFSMLLAFSAYWALFGWWFALGLVASIYVHEMGHVAALRRFGIAATAPMFIPGLGAVVRLKQHPASPIENARVGLAGPLWGLGAALGCLLVYALSGAPAWAAIARVGAWINLFNLLPVWQLDGARGFAALSQAQRWVATAALALAWIATQEGLLVLLAIVAAVRALERSAPARSDGATLAQYVVLVAALSAVVTALRVPGVAVE